MRSLVPSAPRSRSVLYSDEAGMRGKVAPLFDAQSEKAKKPRKYAAWKGFYTLGVSGRFPETPKTDQTLDGKFCYESLSVSGFIWSLVLVCTRFCTRFRNRAPMPGRTKQQPIGAGKQSIFAALRPRACRCSGSTFAQTLARARDACMHSRHNPQKTQIRSARPFRMSDFPHFNASPLFFRGDNGDSQ